MGSSDVISSVELLVLEQELAQGYYKVTENMEASKFEEAETHCTQALHLCCKVEVSYVTLHCAPARAAADKLAGKASR